LWLKGITGRDLKLAQPHTGYWFWLKGIAGRDLRLAQPRRFLVLVKGDRRTGSQVSPTTHRILVLVKGDHRTRSQVSPTTQDFGYG
jgi:hypothetical protein